MATTTPTVWAGLTKANVADAPGVGAAGGTRNEQSNSRIISTADGGFFLVWEDWSGAYNGGLEPRDVTARTFDFLGGKTGSEFNGSYIYNDFDQQAPAIAQRSDGTLVVAYQTTDAAGAGDLENIDVSLFTGTNQGHVDFREGFGALSVHNDTSPAITALSNNRYVVIFANDEAGNNDLSSFIVSPALDINNLPSGTKSSEVKLESLAASATRPDAVTLSNGNYVVAYQSSTNAGDIAFTLRSGTDSANILSGTVASSANAETAPQVAALKGGGFVITWNDAAGDGAANGGIKARVYKSDGTLAVASTLTVNTTTPGLQNEASVIGLADGGFLIAWSDDVSNSVKGQRYSSTGVKVGTEFSVAAGDATHDYTQPDLALMSDGRVAVSVTGNVSGNKDIYTIILDPRTTVDGTSNADTLTSRKDGAVVNGLAGADKLLGYAGADKLDGGLGADTMTGGNGNDTYVVSEAGDQTTEVSGAAGSGIDTVESVISRTLGNFLENLTLTGTAKLSGTGNTLNNVLTGNTANNTLNGLSGNDTINGGAGNDVLTGSTGNDFFDFTTTLSSTTNRDTITDFNPVADTIRLENAIFTQLTATGTLSFAAFWASSTGAAHDADDRIVYNTTTGALSYDSNGSAAGGVTFFATLSTKPVLTRFDFIVM